MEKFVASRRGVVTVSYIMVGRGERWGEETEGI